MNLLKRQGCCWKTVICIPHNRLYYACFYAVSGLLLTEGLSSAKHSGTMVLFERHWIKTEKVPRELGLLYRRLFNRRQKSDYDDLVTFLLADIETWIGEVKIFVEAISNVIRKWEENDKAVPLSP